jgi:hypothetical protein
MVQEEEEEEEGRRRGRGGGSCREAGFSCAVASSSSVGDNNMEEMDGTSSAFMARLNITLWYPSIFATAILCAKKQMDSDSDSSSVWVAEEAWALGRSEAASAAVE